MKKIVFAALIAASVSGAAFAQDNGQAPQENVQNAPHREDARVYTDGRTATITPGRDQVQPTPQFGTNHVFNPPAMPLQRDTTTIVRPQQ